MTLIKTLIDIPERVHQGDFVLKLSEGVQHADQTPRDYVVTPQLRAQNRVHPSFRSTWLVIQT